MHRHKTYDEELAKDLQDGEFAKEFLLSLMEGEEGLDPLSALKHAIRRMGVKEFSEKAQIPYESVCRMLESQRPPKLDTLNRYFFPFGLKIKLTLDDAA